jgi:hypothetical protein
MSNQIVVTERYWINILTVPALENLTDEVKQNFIHEYKACYSAEE